jgi:hypothetical protein
LGGGWREQVACGGGVMRLVGAFGLCLSEGCCTTLASEDAVMLVDLEYRALPLICSRGIKRGACCFVFVAIQHCSGCHLPCPPDVKVIECVADERHCWTM